MYKSNEPVDVLADTEYDPQKRKWKVLNSVQSVIAAILLLPIIFSQDTVERKIVFSVVAVVIVGKIVWRNYRKRNSVSETMPENNIVHSKNVAKAKEYHKIIDSWDIKDEKPPWEK